MMKEIGGGAGDILCSATKDPNMCCRMNLCMSHAF